MEEQNTDKLRDGVSLIVILPGATLARLEELRLASSRDSLAQVAQDAIDFYVRFHAGPAAATLKQLTPRLREVLQLVGEGLSTKKIASQLGISVKTVEMHRTQLMKTLNLRGVADLVRFAIRSGLVHLV